MLILQEMSHAVSVRRGHIVGEMVFLLPGWISVHFCFLSMYSQLFLL